MITSEYKEVNNQQNPLLTDPEFNAGDTANLSKDAIKRNGLLFVVILLGLTFNGVAIGLSSAAYEKNDKIDEVVHVAKGSSFSDDCWSCVQSTTNSSVYELIINARMETKTTDDTSVKNLFLGNGVSIADQLIQNVDGQTSKLKDPSWIGNTIVQEGVIWQTDVQRGPRQSLVYSEGINQFPSSPSSGEIYFDQYNPGRKYCQMLSTDISGEEDVVYMFFSFERACWTSDPEAHCRLHASGSSIGYWPVEQINGTTLPCANYLGASRLYYCVPEQLSDYLGCTSTNIDSSCDKVFEAPFIGLNVPSGLY